MSDNQNKDRVAKALDAVHAHCQIGCSSDIEQEKLLKDDLVDLLTDLMHAARYYNLSWSETLRISEQHFNHELRY